MTICAAVIVGLYFLNIILLWFRFRSVPTLTRRRLLPFAPCFDAAYYFYYSATMLIYGGFPEDEPILFWGLLALNAVLVCLMARFICWPLYRKLGRDQAKGS